MPDMRRQLYEARHHSEFTASIWVHVAADVIQRLRPLAFACIEHLTSASTVERDLLAIEERLLGLAESCACTLFAGGVRIEDRHGDRCHNRRSRSCDDGSLRPRHGRGCVR